MKSKIKKTIILFGVVLCAGFVFCTDSFAQSGGTGKAMKNFREAKQKFDADPSEENFIWYGRRTAYLGKYKEAIDIYTRGIKAFPKSYKMYRHRGHRYISSRQNEKAIADFLKAAELVKGKPLEVEPDGLPNAKNIPLSNTQFNIWYHLGLAYYLTRDFPKAVEAYKECLKWCKNDDSVVAVVHWLYMTYRRMNNKAEAESILKPIKENMTVIESHDYHLLCLLYKGKKSVDALMKSKSEHEIAPGVGSAARWYGIGNWFYYNGNKKKAGEIYKKMTEKGAAAAFGYIAAENDLRQM